MNLEQELLKVISRIRENSDGPDIQMFAAPDLFDFLGTESAFTLVMVGETEDGTAEYMMGFFKNQPVNVKFNEDGDIICLTTEEVIVKRTWPFNEPKEASIWTVSNVDRDRGAFTIHSEWATIPEHIPMHSHSLVANPGIFSSYLPRFIIEPDLLEEAKKKDILFNTMIKKRK